MHRVQELPEVLPPLADLAHRHIVQVAVGGSVDDRHLVLEWDRLVLRLLEHLLKPQAAIDLRLGRWVEVRGELGESLQIAELRQVELQLPSHRAHRPRLCGSADARDRQADVQRRADAGVEQIGLQVDLAVSDRDHVGRDVGRHVVGLGFDDRQRRQRPAAVILVEARRTLQQARVQIEHVAGVGLAARRAPQQQRDLAIGLGVLG